MQARRLVFIVLGLFVLSQTGAFPQDAKTPAPVVGEECGCDDLAQIEYRLREAAVAIDEQQHAFDATSSFTLNTKENYRDNETALLAALNLYSASAPLRSSVPAGELAHTYNDEKEGCTTYFPQKTVITTTTEPGVTTETWTLWKPTACFHEILDVHEAVHRAGCVKRNASLLGRTIFLKDMIQEEIDAYSAENAFSIVQRKRLLCSCPYYQVSLRESRTLPRQPGLWGKPIVLDLRTTAPGPVQAEQDGLHASLSPNAQGELIGDGEGTIGADIALRGILTTVSGDTRHPFTFHISASEPLDSPVVHATLELDAKDGTGTDMVAKNPLATATVHTDLEGGDLTVVNTRKTNPCLGNPPTCGTSVSHSPLPENPHNSAHMHFPKLDSPQSCALFPPKNGVKEDCKARFEISEPFKKALASNGFGSTVGEALQEIAAKNHTVMAVCGDIK